MRFRHVIALFIVANALGSSHALADVPLSVPQGGEIVAVVTVRSNVPASIGVPQPPDGIVITFTPDASEADTWETSMSIRADSAPPGQYFFDLVVTTQAGPLPLERISLTVTPTSGTTTSTEATTTTSTQATTTTSTEATTTTSTEAPTTTSTQATTTTSTEAPTTTSTQATTSAPSTAVPPQSGDGEGVGGTASTTEPELEVAGVTVTTSPQAVPFTPESVDSADSPLRWMWALVGLALVAAVGVYIYVVRNRAFVSSVVLPPSQVGADRKRNPRF